MRHTSWTKAEGLASSDVLGLSRGRWVQIMLTASPCLAAARHSKNQAAEERGAPWQAGSHDVRSGVRAARWRRVQPPSCVGHLPPALRALVISVHFSLPLAHTYIVQSNHTFICAPRWHHYCRTQRASGVKDSQKWGVSNMPTIGWSWPAPGWAALPNQQPVV